MRIIIGTLFLGLSSWIFATPNFQNIKDIPTRKNAFFNYLIPYARSINESILNDRKKIIGLQEKWKKEHKLNAKETTWLNTKAKTYRISSFDIKEKKNWQQLLERVDKLPVSLVLAQAANESAWGTSRFAKQANNYFGQWCFKAGCGLVPKLRPKGRHYEVRKFSSPYEAIKEYMINLNTNRSYSLLRQLRQGLRNDHKTINGYSLAQGLLHYSERKGLYVKSIQAIIKKNQLDQYDVA